MVYEAEVRANCSIKENSSTSASNHYVGKEMKKGATDGFKRTTNTFPGSATKGNKFHAWSAIFPALGAEHARVRAPYIRALSQRIRGNKHALPLRNENWFLSIRAAAARESCVFKTDTLHDGEDGCHTEGLVDAVMEVCAILKLRKRYILGVRAEGGEDCGAQVREGGGVAGEEVEEPGEKGGGGVAACA